MRVFPYGSADLKGRQFLKSYKTVSLVRAQTVRQNHRRAGGGQGMGAKTVTIAGGGPAGLMAAETLAHLGHAVTVYDSMPTVGRKFMLAGKSGLNITHAEPFAEFSQRFGAASAKLAPALRAFTPEDVRNWAADLGTETFIGSSMRVFPTVMKASPLLRAWLSRLQSLGVVVKTRHRWAGFDGRASLFDGPEGIVRVESDGLLLAFGGASWPRLGSDAGWVEPLGAAGVEILPFRAANCGFDVHWSEIFVTRYAGVPVKSVTATVEDIPVTGECVITRTGIEGSLLYAHSARLRDSLEAGQPTHLRLDLMPGRSLERLIHDLQRQGNKASLATRLRKGAGIEGVKAGLLRECVPVADFQNVEFLARAIKGLAIPLTHTRPVAEAISSAGGVSWTSVDAYYMLKMLPGVFVAGEMLDWEAPTGGYLLTACLATGQAAAHGMDHWLAGRKHLAVVDGDM